MTKLYKNIYFKNDSSASKFFLPSEQSEISHGEVAQFLNNLTSEVQSQVLEENDYQRLKNPALLGRYFDEQTRPFYLYHFLSLWVEAVRYLMVKQPHPRILDLGCGTGQTSLLLALLGAEVLGVDCDTELISICNKRKLLYESLRNDLRVEFSSQNVFNIDMDTIAPLDGIYSLFAFNLMKPAAELIPRLAQSLRKGGRFVISDGNQGSIWKLIPSRRRPGTLSPRQLAELLQKNGMKIVHLKTHCIFPRWFFQNPRRGGLAMSLERGLSALPGYKFICVSYTLVAEKVA